MAENQFQIGDVVRLKGVHGSAPDMTVYGIASNEMIITIWYIGNGEYKKGEFPPATLVKTQ